MPGSSSGSLHLTVLQVQHCYPSVEDLQRCVISTRVMDHRSADYPMKVFGRRPIMLASIVFFAVGSAMGGAAQNMATLIAGRSKQ